jgi:hypothetical protein
MKIMCAVLLTLSIMLSLPALEEALENERIYNAILSSLVLRADSDHLISPDKVKYLYFPYRIIGSNDISAVYLLPFQNLRRLGADNVRFVEAGSFAELKALQEITFWGTAFPAVRALSKLPELTHLTLRGMHLSDQDAASLATCTHLQFLDLRYNAVSSLEPFMKHASLKWLDVSGNPVRPEECERLRAACPELHLLSGERPEPDKYFRRAWLGMKNISVRLCSPRILSFYSPDVWEGQIPNKEETAHAARHLDMAGETSYYSCDAAVIVRYAALFREIFSPDYAFLPEDHVFNRFKKNTNIPPDPDGNYTINHVVKWIREHKDTQLLPPSLLLDDMLVIWENKVKY